jgi:hypothetical protein
MFRGSDKNSRSFERGVRKYKLNPFPWIAETGYTDTGCHQK